jgi:tetratricopeptide (TPR) repeat protein
VENSQTCARAGWQDDVARCRWLLGWLDTLAGVWCEAHRQLDEAKSVFERGHMIYELACALLTQGLCFLGEGRLDDAFSSCERALELAAPRNYRLIHADALNLRARIALARNQHSAARDDAELALQIAEPCECAWAQRDSAEILASASSLLFTQ